MNHEEWAEHLASWGYASLRVDSFGPRGIAEICTDIMRPVPRVADVNGAMDVLKADDRIDGERIAVMGFSHGAQMTLLVAGEPGSLAARHKPDLKAAIAFYPYCPTGPARYSPPLMILIGDADDWTPADPCISLADGSTAAGEPIQLVVYEGATHSYDCRACDGEYWGHTLIHNPEAHEDSIQRVHDFLVANLGAGPAPPPSGQSVGEGGLRLDASSLEAALVGSTTEGINAYGNPYTVHILADGKTTGVAGHNNEYVDDGTWWVEGDMYCRRWNQWLEGATGCFNAVIEGDKIRWLNADGSLAREETYTAP
jgi:dienelactone hydrolase